MSSERGRSKTITPAPPPPRVPGVSRGTRATARFAMCRLALRHGPAGSAEAGGKIPHLRQSVPDRQHGFGIVDVQLGFEVEQGDRRREHVDEFQPRMTRHQVAAAAGAILAAAPPSLGGPGEGPPAPPPPHPRRWPPQRAQYWRWLISVLAYVATCSSPPVTRTAAGGHRLKALTGPPDQERQEVQWQ